MIGLSNRLEHAHKGRPAIFGCLGKIGAAPKWLAVWRQEHRERPAALLAKGVERAHIKMIDVRALLTINFDVNEELIHHGSRLFVFEAFMRHHMAPVTSGITNRKQDRLINR